MQYGPDPNFCILTNQMTVIVGIQNSTTEQTTCKLLIFVILKFRKQFLVGTLLFIKTFDRFRDECIYNFFVIIPIQTLIFQYPIERIIIKDVCFIEFSP